MINELPDDQTPTVSDPCDYCGRRVVRVSDNPYDVPPPKTLSAAARAKWSTCVVSRRSRWAYCPRTIKGYRAVPIDDNGTLARVSLERRVALQ